MAVQFIPTLMTGEKNIDEAFSIACGDFAGNVLFYKNGLLKEPVPVIAAGRMYRTPWTRDAAFNTWYAGALLCPSAAKNALLSVLSDKSGKLLIDEEFGQYWDIIIWVWGAWNYNYFKLNKGVMHEGQWLQGINWIDWALLFILPVASTPAFILANKKRKELEARAAEE